MQELKCFIKSRQNDKLSFGAYTTVLSLSGMGLFKTTYAIRYVLGLGAICIILTPTLTRKTNAKAVSRIILESLFALGVNQVFCYVNSQRNKLHKYDR